MSLSFLFFLGVNLLPVLGVLFGNWDAFVLLVLYWLETLVIAFWVMVQTLLERPYNPGIDGQASPLRRVPHFATNLFKTVALSLNAAVFMTAHFLFLWLLFAGPWAERVTTVPEFVDRLVVGTGLWAPLALLFAGRGFLTLAALYVPDFAQWLGAAPEADRSDRSLRRLYGRIATMHITIIAGGWAVVMLGNQKALVAVIAIKIVLDMLLDPQARPRRSGQLGVA